MRVLITGGTGFIGRQLTLALLESNDTPILLLREAYAAGAPLPAALAQRRAAFETVYADLRNYRLTSRAVTEAEADAVIHLAAAGVTDPFLPVERAIRHNVAGTIHLLRACFERPRTVQRLVVARTPGETMAINPYAASKAAAWTFCRMYARTQGWPIVGGMIFQAYGNGQAPHTLIPAAVRAALAGETLPLTHGRQRRDWIAVSDVVEALTRLASADLPPGASLDIGTGTTTSVAEVVAQIYAIAARGGQPLIGALPGRPGEDVVQVADAASTETMLGWRASVTLHDGLERVIAAYESRLR